MKKTKIIYWIITGLFCAFMVFSSLGNVAVNPQSIDLIHTHLGYPIYFIRMVGIAKLLGVLAILIPGFPRIKEWAYAGITFDLISATYSMIAVGYPFSDWALMPVIVAFSLVSYYFYHKKEKESAIIAASAMA
jgi:uncharacterized membrane protein YphA (DoxX/SURF4 family)